MSIPVIHKTCNNCQHHGACSNEGIYFNAGTPGSVTSCWAPLDRAPVVLTWCLSCSKAAGCTGMQAHVQACLNQNAPTCWQRATPEFQESPVVPDQPAPAGDAPASSVEVNMGAYAALEDAIRYECVKGRMDPDYTVIIPVPLSILRAAGQLIPQNPVAYDQPAPVNNPTGKKVLDLVLQDFRDRAERGKAKYGMYLTTGNNRSGLMDLLQELMDGVMYCRQVIEEEAEKPAAPVMDDSRFDLAKYIDAQRLWSELAFGLGRRTEGLLKHIAKELEEVWANPTDVAEWVDVIILALDGAWQAGYTSEEIVQALASKQQLNFARKWPAPGPQDQPNEHVREEQPVACGHLLPSVRSRDGVTVRCCYLGADDEVRYLILGDHFCPRCGRRIPDNYPYL